MSFGCPAPWAPFGELREFPGKAIHLTRSPLEIQYWLLAEYGDEPFPCLAPTPKLRLFGGLTAEESAIMPELPVSTIRRDLRVAQAWHQRELNQDSRQEAISPGTCPS
jgi:hypothetical protein